MSTNFINPIKNNWISREELLELHKKRSWISLSRIFFEYLVLGIIITANILFPSLWLIFPSIILIGSRQHALMVLIHDAAHFAIAKSKVVNDIVGTIIAWTVFADLRGYRIHHIKHHIQKNLNTMEDPDFRRKINEDWKFPMTKFRFYKMICVY